MVHYDDKRGKVIGTPMGNISVEEKKWNEGEEDEHWAVVQDMTRHFDEDTPDCEIVGHFVKQHAICYNLLKEGYEIHSHLDDDSIMWVKYTNQNC